MVRHIVMWKLKGPSPQDKRRQAEEARIALLSLFGKVPGMTQIEVGVGRLNQDEAEADLVLNSTHDSWQALSDYQSHPAHEAVKQLILELRTERRVIDFEL